MDQQTNDGRSKIALLRGLRQVRQFGPEPVARAILDDILEVGRWTGSGMNRQPWDFVLLQQRETLRAIAAAEGGGSHLASAAAAIIIVMAGERSEIETFDEGRLTERLLLAAAAHGVAAGIWWFKDEGAAARRLLGIPPERRVRTAVSFGYPPPTPAAASAPRGDGRKPADEVVHEEHW